MAAAPDLKRLGRYDIELTLGKGAMGVVYGGVDPRLHRKVAIKTILKSALDPDTAKEYSMRFVREAQAVARLNHANIVQVFDFGEEGDIAYIVMEFIKGKELKNFFDANERFETKEAVRIMCELCDALHFAHEAGIIHRDIKPANVMIDSQGKVKLADFGVARITDTDRTQVERTQAGTMVGTPAYMSPEQITGGNIDRRTDIFSAGIILYQFLTGEKPFTGSGAWTIAKKIIQDDPPLPSSINKTISPLFDGVVNKALAKNVETRYQTARDFGTALRRALEGKAEEDSSDKTVVGGFAPAAGAAPSPQVAAARSDTTGTRAGTTAGNQEVELEFWRAIKDGNDPDDFELYVQQFPTGIYAALAKRKIAKLKGVAPEETGAKAREQEKKEAEEASRRESEAREKLAEEKAKLEETLAKREAEYKQREAEAEARRAAAEKARAEADAKREAEAKTRAEAEAKARREEIEKAKKEAEALLAKREAEAKARYEAEMAKREAEAKTRREAEEKARKEVEEKAKKDAEERAKRQAEEIARTKAEAEERAKKQTEELARAKAEAEARAKKEAEERAKREAETAKRESEAARREADLKKKLAEAPKAKVPVAPIIAALVVIASIGGGAYYYLTAEQRARQVALTAALESATKAAEELKVAQSQQLESLKRLEKARADEEAARKAGDTAKLREAQEAAKRAEADATRQGELVKQREAAAAKARDDAKKAADAAKQAAADKAKGAQKQEVARPEAPKAEAPKAETPVAEAPKQEAPKSEQVAAVGKAAAPKAARAAAQAPVKSAAKAAEQQAPPQPVAGPALTREERREMAEAKEATVVASAAPGAAAVDVMTQARQLESEGKMKDAIRIYRRAARAGNGQAAKRLGDIYNAGVPGVPKDYGEALQWYEVARKAGVEVETAKSR